MPAELVFVLAAALIAVGGVLVAFETALGRISSSRVEEIGRAHV